MTPETLQLPALRSVRAEDIEALRQIQNPSVPLRRRSIWPLATRTALATVGVGVCVAMPMINSLHPPIDPLVMPPATTSPYGPPDASTPSVVPSTTNPVEQPPVRVTLPIIPTPIHTPSICETQEGTTEGQLPNGTALLPATMEHPSIFVVSPDRSTEQAFSVHAAGTSDADWNTISPGSDVGIVGIATADTQFRTGDGRAVWAKSCEPTSLAAVDDAETRVHDLCSKGYGFRAVVVYHVGADGKPVEMNTTNC